MGKEVVFDYSKATGFISAEEMANFQKNSYDSKGELCLSKEGAGNDYLGWIDLPVDYDKDEFARIKRQQQDPERFRCSAGSRNWRFLFRSKSSHRIFKQQLL